MTQIKYYRLLRARKQRCDECPPWHETYFKVKADEDFKEVLKVHTQGYEEYDYFECEEKDYNQFQNEQRFRAWLRGWGFVR